MRVLKSKISLPIPNLDNRTFDELFEEARALIPRYAPEWTNHNFSDPGITLIDLFAWLTEMEIYTLNRINDRNFLKFLTLLGETPQAAKPAAVNLEFLLDGYPEFPVVVKKGTQASTVDPSSNEQLVFETDSDLTVSPIKIAHLFSNDTNRFREQTNSNASNSSFYFAFGNQALTGSEFYIAFSAEKGFPENEISLLINTYQADLPALETDRDTFNIVPSAKLEWQYWSELASWQVLGVMDETAALTQNGRIRFQGSNKFKNAKIKEITGLLSSEDRSFYWIRVVVREEGFEIPPRLDSIFINAVTAHQVKTVKDESISRDRVSRQGLPGQTISLQDKPILAGSLLLEVYEEDQIWHRWDEVPDFDASQPNDRHYVIDLQTGEVQFGDGINGRIPPEIELNQNTNIRARQYKAGGGTRGNVKPEAIQSLLTSGIKATVNNPRAAAGGTDVETLESAQQRIRKDLRQLYRAVQGNDFETLAKQTPGLRLQRVKVFPLYNPDYPGISMPGSVTVVAVPYVLPDPDPSKTTVPRPSQGFLRTVANFLEPRCLVASRVHVIGPKFIKVNLEIDLEIDPRKSTELIKGEIEKALRKFLNPNGDKDDPENQVWPFGRAVYKSEIYQVVQRIEGVICVKNVALASDDPHKKINGNISISKIGLVYLGECKIQVIERSGP